MPCNAIICDWNGTLFRDYDEEAILRAIAADVAKSYIPWHPLRFARILKTKNELETLKSAKQTESKSDPISEMFQVYNQKVLNGVPLTLIQRSVKHFAARRRTQDKIEHRALKPVYEFHKAGLTTGILSSGFINGIQEIVQFSPYAGCFDFYVANTLVEKEGKALGIQLIVYRNKAEILLRLLKEKGIDPRKAVYLGDSLDDAECLELVGYPVVSFLASEDLKQTFARKYKAIIPHDEIELTRYLQLIK